MQAQALQAAMMRQGAGGMAPPQGMPPQGMPPQRGMPPQGSGY
jgi:hypothetical protein